MGFERVDGKWWIVDHQPGTKYPIWCRGNVGEVYPGVVSPLTGSMFDGALRGQARWAIEFGMATARDLEGPGTALTAVFGGYLYGNVSLARITGARAPGMKPSDVDEQLFGVIEGAPPYEKRKGDRDLRATLRLTRRLIPTVLRPSTAQNEAARAEIAEWRTTLPPAETASDAELIDVIRGIPDLFERMMYLLLVASGGAGISRSMLERVVEPLGEPGLVNTLTSGLGTIESAQPAFLMWRLGRMVRANPRLSVMFDAGVDGLDERLCGEHAASGFVAAFDEFIAQHGARGPNEWELASPIWATDPDIALAAIDRLRHAPDERDPDEAERRLAAGREAAIARVRRRLRGPKRFLFDRALRAVAIYGAEREATKAAFIRALEPARRAVVELARRTGTTRDDVSMLMIDELPAFVRDPSSFAATIRERRERRDYLGARIPPFWFGGSIPSPETWALRDAQVRPDASERVLTGMGVCTGTASGRARVVLDPADPGALEPGDVLVAPLTDPAWTPLFLAVAAVVVDVGAQQSHAAIIARELGIPAVVSVSDASTTIPDGTWLTVDGDRGTVTVHAAAPA